MKKIAVTFLLLGAIVAKGQDVKNGMSIDSLKESVNEHSMKFSGLDEKLSTMESDLSKLTKIKVSGYIQAQYDAYDTWTAAGLHGIVPASGVTPITNSFFLRRARIKFAYEAADGIKFVLQPDFSFDKVSLKDAYVVLNDRWTKTYSLTVGQFDRLNYEVEYSSGSMESLERTKMAGTLYPGEKELGAKIEANFATKYNFPLKLQLAALNGNFNLGAIGNQVKDIDNNKDIMARALYSIKLQKAGLGIDFGGHGYFGSTEILSLTPTTVGSSIKFSDSNNVLYTPVVGDKLKKEWLGAEVQVYYDFLGGMSLKAEYISGTISGVSQGFNGTQFNSSFNRNAIRDFKGYYVQLVKNIGVKNQFVARFDSFDPNRKLAGDDVSTKDDLKYNTWAVSWQYFFDENVKINVGYSIPINEKSANAALVGTDFANTDKKDNTFTIRLQAKF